MTIGYSYHRIIRKVTVAFGNLFNEITLSRYDQNGQETENFLVPIVYGGKEKYVHRLEGDPNLDKKVQVTLPIISFELLGMTYDASRKLNTNNKITAKTCDGANLAVYNPVPIDFEFSMFIYVRNIEDGAQIIEKIAPFFGPDQTVNINLIPEMGITKQFPIILKDMSQDIDYEGDYNSKVRTVIWNLNFTVKGYLYGAVSEPKIIRSAFVNIFDDISMNNDVVNVLMKTGGNGDYKLDERVYQGFSYETAEAFGQVHNWNSQTKKLTLKNFTGTFLSNAAIIGVDTGARWTVDRYEVVTVPAATINVKPNPEDVILPNTYTYTTTITEFPNN